MAYWTVLGKTSNGKRFGVTLDTDNDWKLDSQ